MPPITYPHRIYFWLIRDCIAGRMRKTRWRMSEQDAAHYPGAVRLDEDSLEITGPAGPGFNPSRSELP